MCETLNVLEERIGELLKNKKPILIALDGRCAAGKTTLAQKLAKDLSVSVNGGLQESFQDLGTAAANGGSQSLSQDLSAAVIHIDDFFLRPFQRTAERLSEPGGNFDRERFLKEVLLPLRSGEQPLFRPYNCHTDSFLEEIKVPEKKIYIIEGSYSCHPALKEFYDLSIFVTTTPKKQLERLEKRNKDLLQDFINKWIPYEEKYFKAFDISDGCDFVFET